MEIVILAGTVLPADIDYGMNARWVKKHRHNVRRGFDRLAIAGNSEFGKELHNFRGEADSRYLALYFAAIAL